MATAKDIYDNLRDQSAEAGGSHVGTQIVDPGHVYMMPELGVLRRDPHDVSRYQEMRFLKRSGGAIQYEEEWDGLQAQTVIRVLIDRTRYLYDVLPCRESLRAIRYLQNALWEYEARAFRRKIQSLNREQPAHEEDIPIPFGPMECETHELGRDGHLCWLESAMLYRINFGAMDYEPWDEFWFSAEELGIPKVGT
jgi:hypothetical protein